ncbi:autotransporter domain-containing protein [Candidatus Pelagibacter sp.]|uniref:autotransporter domain-containing protein n=1 Tax=Candidatus Pelagibacter sp. TaxID=2024849 RepID=UPI003F82ED6A
MSLLKKILIIFFFLIPFSNSFAAMVTKIDDQVFQDAADDKDTNMGGPEFNKDGTKMFVSYHNVVNKLASGADDFIAEYTLSTPFDISTATYAGDSERCSAVDPDHDNSMPAGDNATTKSIIAFKFSDDGKKIFTAQRGMNENPGNSFVNRFDLTTPFDVSTCTYNSDVDIDTTALQNGTNAGDRSTNDRNNLQGIEITNDGTKLFVTMNENGGGQNIKQYNFGTPYDLSTLTLASTAIILDNNNPFGMEFSKDGKRLFQSFRTTGTVVQFSLSNAFDLSSSTKDGEFSLKALDDDLGDLIGIKFSSNGLKIFAVNRGDSKVFEYSLGCAFTLVAGSCPSITEDKDRTGMALAQIEIAKRTIDHSTDTALNRLKWIRRNKDKQNLTNLNINFKFTDQRLASLTEAVKTSAAKKKKKDKEENVFYWSEGSIAIGRIGDTSISSTKKIDTDAITFGADKFTDGNGIKGWAFRIGRNNVDVGTAGSNLDTDTYNITYYSTSPIKNDTKFLDSVIGFGKLNSDLLTVLEGEKLAAERSGHQIYGTIRIKDEIKKDNLTLIPSGRFDIGHTYLGFYEESGSGGIDVEGQRIMSKKIRASLAAVEDLSGDKYDIKRHGKIEYIADIDRSSDFEYTYVSDSSVNFNNTLDTGALHNINGEIGIDIVLPDRFSIFLIYERNQALGSGHTDKLHIALGYLPNKETNFAFSIDGVDNFKSNYVLSKNINDYNIDLKLTNDLMRPEEYDEVSFNLKRKF